MPEPREAELAVAYYLRNKEHLTPSSPTWEKDYFDVDRWPTQYQWCLGRPCPDVHYQFQLRGQPRLISPTSPNDGENR